MIHTIEEPSEDAFKLRGSILSVCLFVLSSSVFGATLFSDDFEGGTLATNWIANSSGQIVVDPLSASNHVLHFTSLGSGGDIFSNPILNVPTFYLSFDYMFQSPSPFGGGFIGNNDPGETWLAGDCNGCYGTYSPALDGLSPDVWHHIEIQFTPTGAGPLTLKLEQFQGTPGNAYFDNIVLSDALASVPEPSSAVLLLLGLAGVTLGLIRKKSV